VEFDLEAWIGLDVVDDLVVAGYKLGDSDPPAFGSELAQLIEIEGDELLNLEDVDPVGQVRIPTQSGRGFRFEAGHRSDLIPATIPK
jgi:hypothetical protein